jgi:FtsH-binding integral membrane protein
MQTVYDWVTVGLFAALVVLFLQRSMADEGTNHNDSILLYLVAGAGCAAVNFLGNRGMHVPAVVLLAGTIAFILYFLRPFRSWPRS